MTDREKKKEVLKRIGYILLIIILSVLILVMFGFCVFIGYLKFNALANLAGF